MRMDKICIKFFVAGGDDMDRGALIPTFHRWIREKRLPGMLIDVADYRHVRGGPSVMIVGHEADFVVDGEGGNAGLMCRWKHLASGEPREKIAAVIKAALEFCREFEKDCGVRVDKDRFLFVVNDRLDADNSEAAFRIAAPPLAAAAKAFFNREASLERASVDPRDRLAILVS